MLFEVKNGETALATGNKVEQGTTITITVVYNEDDYTITVKVNGTAITGVEGVYTYQVTGDVEITAELKENLNTPEKIVNAAYALAKDTSLEGTYTLTGKIISVDAVYDTQYKNVTVTIVVGDMTDKPIQCFRMKGTDADKVAVNDTITVTGTLVNYNGTVEFNSGCSLDARVVGTSTISVSEESSANATVTITDGLTSGENGTTFTFTVAVASGHELVSVKVNNKVVDAAEGQYTCTINGNMVIVVETKAEGTASKAWTKVTDASTLAVGDKITFVYEDGKMEMGALSANGKYVTNVAYTDLPIGVFAVTIENGVNEGTFAFKTIDGKYLSSDNGNNMYGKEEAITAATSWTISIDAGNAVITNVSTSRIIRYNTGSPRFAAYASNSSVKTPVQIYKYA